MSQEPHDPSQHNPEAESAPPSASDAPASGPLSQQDQDIDALQVGAEGSSGASTAARPERHNAGDPAQPDAANDEAKLEEPASTEVTPDRPKGRDDENAGTAAGAEARADAPAPEVETRTIELPDFSDEQSTSTQRDISVLRDVDLKVHIELGRTMMYIEDILKLAEGSVVALDNLAGDPVDVYVNSRLVARGEVLVLNDNFCVRVSEIVEGPQSVPVA
jgi:flagellar motor switch protein FliN/FliY